MHADLKSKPISIFELKRSPTAVFEGNECDAVAVFKRDRLMGYVVPTETYELMVSRIKKLEAELESRRLADAEAAA